MRHRYTHDIQEGNQRRTSASSHQVASRPLVLSVKVWSTGGWYLGHRAADARPGKHHRLMPHRGRRRGCRCVRCRRCLGAACRMIKPPPSVMHEGLRDTLTWRGSDHHQAQAQAQAQLESIPCNTPLTLGPVRDLGGRLLPVGSNQNRANHHDIGDCHPNGTDCQQLDLCSSKDKDVSRERSCALVLSH